jgi:hypothetical protein
MELTANRISLLSGYNPTHTFRFSYVFWIGDVKFRFVDAYGAE